MKKLSITALVYITIYTILVVSCKNKSKSLNENMDLDLRQPVSTDLWRNNLVDRIQNAPNDSIRISLLKENGQQLSSQLIYFLRSNSYTCKIDSNIIYRYGSGYAKGVASGDGNKYNGDFKPQPYAVVKGGSCFHDSLFVFIRCFNGMFELMSKDQRIIGNGSTNFTIEKGAGLNKYVNYKTSIWIADYFHIPIYIGKDMAQKISATRAFSLEPRIAYIQVAPKVYAGDHFDLGTMTYTRSTSIKPTNQ